MGELRPNYFVLKYHTIQVFHIAVAVRMSQDTPGTHMSLFQSTASGILASFITYRNGYNLEGNIGR